MVQTGTQQLSIDHFIFSEYTEEPFDISNSDKTILSLFDHSGTWSQPYWEAGYNVVELDIKNGMDINDINIEWFADHGLDMVHGVLAAVPCTDFAVCGAKWFKEKDKSGSTEKSLELLYQVLRIVEYLQPEWWVIENPVGRIPTLVPELGKPVMYFQPCDYGDPYTKKTGLWGEFNTNLPKNEVEPVEGSKMWKKYGGKSERTKTMRSITPNGFTRAFFRANP